VVNRIFVLLILIASCVLVGCASENSSLDKLDTPTNIVEVTPTSTIVPTEAKTLTPTATIISATPTLYLTPLPTLSIEQERVKFYQFYNFINGCRLP
jgi:hypothetical protein